MRFTYVQFYAPEELFKSQVTHMVKAVRTCKLRQV